MNTWRSIFLMLMAAISIQAVAYYDTNFFEDARRYEVIENNSETNTYTVRITGYSDSSGNGAYVGDFVIPSTVTHIDSRDGNTYVYTVTEMGDNMFYGSGFDYKYLSSVTIPNTIKKIGYSCFSGARKLTSIVIPEGVEEIGTAAFEGLPVLASVSLPSTLRSLGERAFGGCGGLTTLTIPSEITVINPSTFINCSKLETVHLPDGITSIGSNAFYGCGKLETVNIPTSLVEIGKDAFNNCQTITSLVFPTTLRTIGESAFFQCTGLTSIVLPEGTTTIGNYAFQWCENLASVTIPSTVTYIGYYAFKGCALTSIVLPEGLQTLGEGAFRDNVNLASANLPVGIGTLVKAVFANCGFISFTFPEGFTTIPRDFLAGCKNLTEVTIAESVTSIQAYAFSECTSLETLTIPKNVTQLDGLITFRSSVSTLVMKGTTPPAITGSIDAVWREARGQVIVPVGTVATYRAAEVWGHKNDQNEYDWVTNILEEDHFTVSLTVGSHGSVTWPGDGNLTNGSTSFMISGNSVALSFVPEKQCVLSQVLVDDVVVTADVENLTYLLENSENGSTINVSVTFEQVTSLELADGEKYDNTEDWELEELSYSRTYKNTNWQAWYVPFDMTVTDDLLARFSFGKFAGTYTAGDEFFLTVAYLKLGDVMKANTPYFIKAKVADSSNPQVITLENTELKAADETGFIMLSAEKKVTIQGIYSAKVATAEDQDWYAYGGGLYRHPTVGQTLSPYRFFLTIEDREDNPYSTTPAPAEVKLLVLDDMETSIESLGDEMNRENEAIYDLSGRRMNGNKLNKGIYIINGKKVSAK